MELSPGINVLYGENESGKTTLHTFIKCMLYGIQRSRGRAARSDVYTKYEPWENPAEYGGILWIEEEGKEYRLTRSFARDKMTEELYCETDGELLDMDEGALDDLLGGVSETVYENTVSVGQLKSVTGKELIQELQNYMVSYQGTGDASVDLGKAEQMLKMTRKGYLVQAERQRKSRESAREKLEAKYEYAYQEMEILNQKRKMIEQKNAEGRTAVKNDQKTLEKRLVNQETSVKHLWIGMAATVALVFLLMSLFLFVVPSLSYMCIIALLAGIASVAGEIFYIKKLTEDQNKTKRQIRALKKREDKFDWNEESISDSLVEKRTNLENLRVSLEEFQENSIQPSQTQVEIDAINLAMETMEQLTRKFRSNMGGRLRRRTSEILSEITDGKYREVLIRPDFTIHINAENRIVPLESLSRGTIEQIYFALRMAAGEMLCGDTCFPVILDDVFGMYDEDRLAGVLHWLEKEPRQVIISTCHRREIEILNRERIAFHEISFS